jgi:hypothetical protein
MSFVHHFPRGTLLRRPGDRVTYAFVALEGQISLDRVDDSFESTVSCAPDGVAFARTNIRCQSDAVVCCVPDMALARVMRRHPDHAAELRVLLEESQEGQSRAAIFR